MVNGIFMYYRGAGYIKEVLDALRSLDIHFRAIETNREIVSNLIPKALIRGAESWLIFFRPDNQQELLILPFPDENCLQRFGNPPYFRGYLADLIPTVNKYFTLTSEDFYVSVRWIGRFQYIRLDSSLNSLLEEIFDGRRSQSEVEIIQETLLKTSQDIQQTRNETLRKTLRTGDQTLLNELDEVFATENDGLFSFLQTTQGFVEVVPPIVNNFEDIMDDETKKFLISSETVKKFVDDNSPDHFDYSLPGCGLWKAVERELNLSLVLHLRWKNDIASDDPWIGNENTDPVEYAIGSGKSPRTVNINQRDKSQKFKSIMLGDMRSMLTRGYHNGIHLILENLLRLQDLLLLYLHENFSEKQITECINQFRIRPDLLPYLFGRSDKKSSLDQNSLPNHLKQLTELRNGHSHISAMSLDKFEELRNLVLPSNDDQETCLVKILQLKSKVFEERGALEAFRDLC